MSFHLLKIFNHLSAGLTLEFDLKKLKISSTSIGHKSRSGADIELLFNYQFSIFFGPLYVLKGRMMLSALKG